MSAARAADRSLVSPELLARVQHRLADRSSAEITAADVAGAVRGETGMVVSDAQMLRVIRALQHELVGAGPLAELLADPATTDVVVNGPRDVRVDRGSGWEATGITFDDDAAVQRLARRLAAGADRRVDAAQPYVDAQLPDGTRLHAVLAPIAVGGTCLSLRVLRPASFGLAALAERATFPESIGAVMRQIVERRIAFLVSGGTGTGKTTLLAALLAEVDPAERLITVEDAGELRPSHPHVLHLVARPGNVEGNGAVGLRELVRQALRMRPDRLIVGEVRGAEVVDLVIALNTGHRGGAGTVHANTAADVPARLTALAALGGMPAEALHAQLAGAVQVVLHLERVRIGSQVRRRIAEVAVLDVDGGGRVRAVTAYDAAGIPGPGAVALARLLAAPS